MELQEPLPTNLPADSPLQEETSMLEHQFPLLPQEPMDLQFPHPPQEPTDQPALESLDMDHLDTDHLPPPLQLELPPMVPLPNPPLPHQELDQLQDIPLELLTEQVEPLELLEVPPTEHLESLEPLPMVLPELLEELPMELQEAFQAATLHHHMELETLATLLEPMEHLELLEAVLIHPSHLQD